MKKVLSLVLAVIMIASFSVFALADETYSAFSYYTSSLTEEQINELNDIGNALVENYGVAAIISVYSSSELEDLKATADADFENDGCGCEDQVHRNLAGNLFVNLLQFYFIPVISIFQKICKLIGVKSKPLSILFLFLISSVASFIKKIFFYHATKIYS